MTQTAPPGFLAAMLYGSQARGDNDNDSDRDVFVAVEDIAAGAAADLRAQYASRYATKPESLSIYSRRSIAVMAQRGSLFLWHLKLEGQIIEDQSGFIAASLHTLQPYSRYADDLSRYQTILDGVEASLEEPKRAATECDLHSLYVVARNAMMLLTFFGNAPAFGRKTVYARAATLFEPLPLPESTYRTLESWHLCYSRGTHRPGALPSKELSLLLIRKVSGLLQYVRGTVLPC